MKNRPTNSAPAVANKASPMNIEHKGNHKVHDGELTLWRRLASSGLPREISETPVYQRASTPLIAGQQQASGDDLGLNFCRALEDVEDTGVAHDSADRVFLGIAVATVNLQGVVGVRPSHASAQ